MSDDKWVVQSYSFSNINEYEKAKKEQETVAYVRANTNLNNIKVVAKLYSSLIEKETFDTIVGYRFLEELRQILLSEDLLSEEALPFIPVKAKDSKFIRESVANEQYEKYKNLYEKTNHKKKISIYANFFLAIIIVAMMVLSVMTNHGASSKTEAEILDKYASWAQELQQKEDELNQREELLNELQNGK